MTDDIKNKPERPVQEPLTVGGETKCKNCEQPKSAHLVSGHIYCPVSLGRACWYEPIDAATPAPSQEPQLHPMIYGCLDCGTMSKLEPWQKVRCPERDCQSDNVRHLKTQADIDSFVTVAPSQPVGAREFVHSIEYDSPLWDAKMSLVGKMPSRVFDDVCTLMDAFAAQQTAPLKNCIMEACSLAEWVQLHSNPNLAHECAKATLETLSKQKAGERLSSLINQHRKAEREAVERETANVRSIISSLRDYYARQTSDPYLIQELDRALKVGKTS